MKPLNVVVAGMGARGKYWAEVVKRSPACELAAYVDPNPEALEEARRTFGEQPTFASVEATLAKTNDVQVLVLATPPEGREVQIRAACEHGVPLLVEKPLALDVVEAAKYVQLAEDAGVPLVVGLNFRYLGVTRELVKLFASGAVGKPAFARFTYERWRDGKLARLNKYPLVMKHPMLWEQSIHHFDLMRFVYQKEPATVYCKTWNPSWSMYQGDTNVSAVFTFEDDLVVNYQGTWQSAWQQPHFEWRTDCSEGVVSQGDQFGALAYARRHDATLSSLELPPHEQWVTDTAGVLEAFVRHLRDGAPLECSGRDHLQSLRMVQGCILSAARQEPIQFESLQEVVM